jgi:tetraacyldisaccharide 4'-kinase
VPVIVVGNVIVGGAGKTPLVMALVRHLQERGLRPGVISRGHGRSDHSCLEVRTGMTARQCGDEPLLIHQRTAAPVFVDSDRVQAAEQLLQSHPEVDIIVADDGLQHHRLWRDVNIAVFDERGLGNRWVLPAGPLREHWPRKTRSTQPPVRGIDLTVLSSPIPDVSGLLCRRELSQRAYAPDGSTQALSSLRGRRLHALAGIAKPEAFFDMLRQQGLQLEETHAFADHHDFSVADLPDDPQITLLITEKDAVKLMPLAAGLKSCLLAVPLQLHPDPALFEAIDAFIRKRA